MNKKKREKLKNLDEAVTQGTTSDWAIWDADVNPMPLPNLPVSKHTHHPHPFKIYDNLLDGKSLDVTDDPPAKIPLPPFPIPHTVRRERKKLQLSLKKYNFPKIKIINTREGMKETEKDFKDDMVKIIEETKI